MSSVPVLLAFEISNSSLSLAKVGVIICLLILSLGVHEAAHGWVAWKCGDSTARDMGRVTLNPLAHIDPFMTVVMPLFLYLSSGFVFGGAKPVPVVFHNLRHPHRDMALVALAGPVSNIAIATALIFAYKILAIYGIFRPGTVGFDILQTSIYFNLLLAAFNLVPVPPLDGSRILAWLLPRPLRDPYVSLERYGMLIIFGLFFMVPGFLGLVRSITLFLGHSVETAVSLGGLW